MRPEAALNDTHVRRRRQRWRDLLLVSVPALFGVLILLGYRWYDHFIKQSTNRELVALVLRTFADGTGLSMPLPVGVDRTISRVDLFLTVNDEIQLKRLLGPDVAVADPWGASLRARRGVDWLEVRSAGADGMMETDDDLFGIRPDTPRDAATTAPRSIDRGASAEP